MALSGTGLFLYPGVAGDSVGWFRTGLLYFEMWKFQIQFLLVFLVVTWVYFKIHGTYIGHLLKGFTVILGLYLLSGYLKLEIISGILQAILHISIIGFIILFQPELRRLLVYLGQPDFFSKQTLFSSGNKGANPSFLIHELVESIRLLSKTKTGALIVLENHSGLGGSYLEAGTKLNANLSTELLLTIFHPNTPLHDGAVIISPDNQIVAAGVLLPLSENPNLSWKYGTRHRAAIGLSEISDSRCLVVSEETGTISVAHGGALEKFNTIDDLKRYLETVFHVASDGDKNNKRPFGPLLSTDIFQTFFTKPEPPPKNPGSKIGS